VLVHSLVHMATINRENLNDASSNRVGERGAHANFLGIIREARRQDEALERPAILHAEEPALVGTRPLSKGCQGRSGLIAAANS
jgi:hypothetical protein